MFSTSDKYMCYVCDTKRAKAEDILNHCITAHISDNTDLFFTLRERRLCRTTGSYIYQTIRFGAKFSFLRAQMRMKRKVYIDMDRQRVSVKRPADSPEKESGKNEQSMETENEEAYRVLPDVINKLNEMDRLDDFISVLKHIATGHLDTNIAFHLLLDVGRFYGCNVISDLRYDKITMEYWVTHWRLLKGKGINFHRGSKGEGLGTGHGIKPTDCAIDFAVPSDYTSQRAQYFFKTF